MENGKNHPSQEFEPYFDWQKLQEMARIRHHFYIAISDPHHIHVPEELYEDRKWVSSFMGEKYASKLTNFFEKCSKQRWLFRDLLVRNLASEGKESEAWALCDEVEKYDHDQAASEVNKGLTEWNLRQGRPLIAFEKSIKVQNIHQKFHLWESIIKASNKTEKEVVWSRVKNELDASTHDGNNPTVSEIVAMIDNLVKAAYQDGDIIQSKKLLEVIGSYTPLVDEFYDDMDTGRSYPRNEAYIEVGKGWAKIGDFNNAKEWMQKGEVKNLDREITMSLFDWGSVKEEDVIKRIEGLEINNKISPGDYLWKMGDWLEEHPVSESQKLWTWLTSNPNIIEAISEDKHERMYLGRLWNMAKKIGDASLETVYLDKLKKVAGDDTRVWVEINLDAVKKAINWDEKVSNLDLAWESLKIKDIVIEYNIDAIESILKEWVKIESWDKIETSLNLLVKASKTKGSGKDPRLNQLLFKYYAIVFKNRHGDFEERIDFSRWGNLIHKLGWSEGRGDAAAILLDSDNDLKDFLSDLDFSEQVLTKLKLANIGQELSIDNEVYGKLNISWAKGQLKLHLGKPGEVNREIVKACLDYILEWGERDEKTSLGRFLNKNSGWWNDNVTDLYKDMIQLINGLVKARWVGSSVYTEISELAKKMVIDRWAEGDSEILNLAANMLGQRMDEESHNWIATWISTHTDDLAGSNKELVRSRLAFLEAGLNLNIDKVNFLAYQLCGEEVFDNSKMLWVIQKLVENRFLEEGILVWQRGFFERHGEDFVREKAIMDIGHLIAEGIFPRTEVFESFFNNLDLTFEQRLAILRQEAGKEVNAFQTIFQRDAIMSHIKRRELVRCVIGSVYGEPVFLVQNFNAIPQPVDGHHEILGSWMSGEETLGTPEDIIVQKYISMLVEKNDLAVEHFLRGFLALNSKGELTMTADAGFLQSSVGSRAEIIPKVSDTAKKFGIAHLEEMPDDEYAELQRLGFMRGAIKNFAKVIRDNLGENDVYRFTKLAKRFFVDREFDETSSPYQKLKSYLDLIEYYRNSKKSNLDI